MLKTTHKSYTSTKYWPLSKSWRVLYTVETHDVEVEWTFTSKNPSITLSIWVIQNKLSWKLQQIVQMFLWVIQRD